MKKFALIITFILLSFIKIDAEQQTVSMANWKYKSLTWFSDQNENVVVSKYYDNNGHYGFCLEPEERYNLFGTDYYKNIYYDEDIFNIVKAYDLIGKQDDNYYIAAQILIWEKTNGIKYTFKNNDYKIYKDELLKCIANNFNKPLLTKSNQDLDIIESNVNEELLINKDYSNYEIESDDIKILNYDEDGLNIKVVKSDPEIQTIKLTPKYDPKDYAYSYTSKTYQDIYSFEGTYDLPEVKYLKIKAINPPEYIDIYYSKKDLNGNYIKDAEFTVYQLDSNNNDTELAFIHLNTNVNLYEALLDDYVQYSNLSIELSERYSLYLNDGYINTNELGYFPYKIYNENQLIKQGIVYVTDDNTQSNGSYKRINVKQVFKGNSEAKPINTINNIEKNKMFYLCESEPAKGYIYTQKPCVLLDTSSYNDETIEFINDTRTYTLKLMKQNPYEVLLDGAKFKISYLLDEQIKNVYLTTGFLSIERDNNYKYLIFKHEDDQFAVVNEFDGDLFETNDVKQGKYYYYQSNNSNIDYSLLNDSYTIVVKGGFMIENMPYSSSLTIEELKAPDGYMIENAIYHVEPNISFSEITFRNYRVNEFYIKPKKKYKSVKTCIDE